MTENIKGNHNGGRRRLSVVIPSDEFNLVLWILTTRSKAYGCREVSNLIHPLIFNTFDGKWAFLWWHFLFSQMRYLSNFSWVGGHFLFCSLYSFPFCVKFILSSISWFEARLAPLTHPAWISTPRSRGRVEDRSCWCWRWWRRRQLRRGLEIGEGPEGQGGQASTTSELIVGWWSH